MVCGGAETRTMEIYRRIDKKKVQFDFLTLIDEVGYYDKEIYNLGGKIYTATPPKENLFLHLKEVYEIINNQGPFYAVHAHTSLHSGLILLIAYLSNVKVRISHSRTSSGQNNSFYRKIYIKIMKILIKYCATDLVACSKLAADYLFDNSNRDIRIIENAIDFNRFKELENRNLSLRKKLNIDKDDFIIGHVGSFRKVKNHQFILKILKKLESYDKKYKMVFVGTGKLFDDINNQTKKVDFGKKTLFLGQRSDVPELMAMFDLLLLPSLYEGLPGVIVEAQAAGTPCFLSDNITEEVDAGLNLLKFLSLKNENKWAEMINNAQKKQEIDKEKIYMKFKENNFNVESSIDSFYQLYNIEK